MTAAELHAAIQRGDFAGRELEAMVDSNGVTVISWPVGRVGIGDDFEVVARLASPRELVHELVALLWGLEVRSA